MIHGNHIKVYCVDVLVNIKLVFFYQTLFKVNIYCSDKIYQFIFGVSPYNYKGKLYSFIVKEIFIEIGFKNVHVLKNLFPVTYIFKGHAKIVKICMVKFSVTISN